MINVNHKKDNYVGAALGRPAGREKKRRRGVYVTDERWNRLLTLQRDIGLAVQSEALALVMDLGIAAVRDLDSDALHTKLGAFRVQK